jgi:threonyl-tRNA synthetase
LYHCACPRAAEEICKAKHPFQRLVVSKQEALELFAHNPFKVNLISNKVPEGSKVSECADLSRGR